MQRPVSFEPNPIRQKMQAGRLVCGSVISTMSPGMMHAAGFAGLDFIRIDAEHQWVRTEQMEFVIQTAVHGGVCPIVRVDRDDDFMPRKILELGAGGIVFPQMENTEDVRRAVSTSKFPPVGRRGYSSICWSGGWGAKTGAKWVEWCNTQPLVGIMIESALTEPHLEEMIAVEGVDFVLFGPADYSMSLGLGAPNTKHPRVVAALEKTIEAARRHGRSVMMGLGTKKEDIIHYRDMGVTMFELDHDIGITRAVWSDSVDFIEGLQPA
jgi:4-hydroxy-2-oxoheptanedioate aldolase